jgi:hypothetical protein
VAQTSQVGAKAFSSEAATRDPAGPVTGRKGLITDSCRNPLGPSSWTSGTRQKSTKPGLEDHLVPEPLLHQNGVVVFNWRSRAAGKDLEDWKWRAPRRKKAGMDSATPRPSNPAFGWPIKPAGKPASKARLDSRPNSQDVRLGFDQQRPDLTK